MSEETQTTQAASEPSKGGGKKKHFYTVIAMLGFLFLLAVGVAGYFYYQLKSANDQKPANEMADILKTIGKVMELPAGEPTLATVTDKEKLADQPFFQKAENGDKVLIYADAGRAILYRPSTKKVVDVSVINVKKNENSGETTSGQTPETPVVPPAGTSAETTPPATSQISIALYNGSTKVGVTNTLETQINEQFPLLTVGAKEKAAKSDYTGTQVIDLSGKNADFVTKLAEAIGGKVVTTLPEGEVNPGTDILVIVGQK